MAANVQFQRKELTDALPYYQVIQDCLAGQATIKARTDVYLPRPNAADTSEENKARYIAYVARAVFYNVTKRTLNGLVGQVFLRDPVVEVPTDIDIVVKDTNGNGVNLEQTARFAASEVLSLGRAGMLADYPNTAGKPTTVQDLRDGKIRPTISIYEAKNIINWRTRTIGGKVVLELVVLVESYVLKDDGFQIEYGTQYRVLKLNEANEYVVELWRESVNNSLATPVDTYQPLDAKGNTIKEIPFSFIGSRDNSQEVDDAPLYDLATLNIGHYVNSAEYEDSCYMLGQPTPWFSGLTEDWVKDVLGGKVALGARGIVPLPVGGEAGLLQAEPNTLAFEAMEHKERQMVALGARLVQEKAVQRTLGEAQMEESSETSVLATVSKNVSAAIKWGLEWCAIFTGSVDYSMDAEARGKLIKFELNTEFDLTKMSAQERLQLMKEWQGNAITFSEYREILRKAGIATLDDEQAQAELDAQTEKQLTNELAQAEGLAKIAADNAPEKAPVA